MSLQTENVLFRFISEWEMLCRERKYGSLNVMTRVLIVESTLRMATVPQVLIWCQLSNRGDNNLPLSQRWQNRFGSTPPPFVGTLVNHMTFSLCESAETAPGFMTCLEVNIFKLWFQMLPFNIFTANFAAGHITRCTMWGMMQVAAGHGSTGHERAVGNRFRKICLEHNFGF